jgi:hypothetical protein
MQEGGERVRFMRAAGIGVAVALLASTAAQAAELSTSDRLQDRREVSAGTRAYSVGFEDGRFYANGWHITGEMGGVWTPPLKLVDGVWFGVNGEWAGQATRFTSGWGYTRYALPSIDGLRLRRTDFVPDGVRGALFGLTLTNPGRHKRTVTVTVNARSELMGQYPWGFEGVTPNASENLPDTGAFTGRALAFRDQGALSQGPAHDYAAFVGSDRRPRGGSTGDGFWGAQSGTKCDATDGTSMPSACDDGPFGNGTGGELRYRVKVKGHRSTTLWIAAAGSDEGGRAAREEFAKAIRNPGKALARKIASRRELSRWSRVTLPGDARLADAVDWGKQNLADLTLTAENVQVRWTNQGKQFPAPSGTVPEMTWFGAGYPDYPWLFATDGEYTNFAGVALGQFETAKAHLRALRDVSEKLNPDTGVVVHEVVPDGSVWFGKDTVNPDTGRFDFNTDETVKFPSAVALVWRWTGDDAFMRDLYGFSKRNLHYVVEQLDDDHDLWPEGSGNVEREGMGAEKLDNAVYLIRGLYDFEAMAKATGHADDATWAREQADERAASFEDTWWIDAAQQYGDSLVGDENVATLQKHWIGVNPMEAELHKDGNTIPGLAAFDHGDAALAGRENSCYSGERPYNRGLFHTGCGGGPTGAGERTIFSLGTAVQAVGEGNYGRMGPDEQKRYTDADAETMFAEPALDGEAAGEPDEQPGAMPEILPSPDFAPGNKNILRCWTCRSMFMQAWGNYGTAWPVIHQQLGVQPDLGNGALAVVPQVPDGQPSVQGRNIRLGDGSVNVLAAHDGSTYTTRIDASRVRAGKVTIGHTLPHGAEPSSVTLDGHPVTDYAVEQTNRGAEVTVPADAGRHTLVVTG